MYNFCRPMTLIHLTGVLSQEWSVLLPLSDELTHRGRVKRIGAMNKAIIGSDNDLWLDRCQVIVSCWRNDMETFSVLLAYRGETICRSSAVFLTKSLCYGTLLICFAINLNKLFHKKWNFKVQRNGIKTSNFITEIELKSPLRNGDHFVTASLCW